MNKQDKEKIRELAHSHQGTMTDSQYLQMQYALEEMATWKEQQMIEKAVEWLEPIFKDLAGYNCGGDLINDFKKYMGE